MKRLLLVLLCLTIPAVYAWTPSGETVKITEILHWDNNAPVIFKTSGGHYCYIPVDEERMYSLVLAIYSSGRSASIHCYGSEEVIRSGQKAHRVHRVVGLP